MMTSEAFAIGVTAALDPLTESNSDMWLWHSFFDIRRATAGDDSQAIVQRIVIDSKAMRKGFDPERVMVGVVGATESGVATAEFHADTRQLFLL